MSQDPKPNGLNPRLYRALSFDDINILIDTLEGLEDITPTELAVQGKLIEIKGLMLRRRQDEDAGLIPKKNRRPRQ